MPRPIHFEIHAENTERAIRFYTALFGWEFNRWGKEAYWRQPVRDDAGRSEREVNCPDRSWA